MKYAFIKAHRSEFRVEKMCQVLKISKSGYYSWLKAPESQRQKENNQLKEKIVEIHTQTKGRYGSPRLKAMLKREGYQVSHNRVARLMKEIGIRAKARKHKIRTTDSSHRLPVAKNKLNRKFDVNKPNSVWCSDITYVATAEGWLYLCIFLDLYSRKVVGWSMRPDLKADLATEALDMAVVNRQPKQEVMIHSDRGVQYAAENFRGILDRYGFVQSMSRKGDCWDNACSESFFNTLKREGCDTIFTNRAEAKTAIFEYIEVFYNRQRLHSTLGYLSPEEFELLLA